MSLEQVNMLLHMVKSCKGTNKQMKTIEISLEKDMNAILLETSNVSSISAK